MAGSIHLGLTGDVMIGRGVDKAITQTGYLYPWGNVLPLLQSAAINIINLETALTNSEQQVPKVFNFKASPDKVKTLTAAHITVANLANNHILDFAEAGLLETLRTLDGTGIQHTGAGMNELQAAQPAIFKTPYGRAGVLGFTDNEYRWKAGPGRSGINYIDVGKLKDRQRALTSIKHLRKAVDLLLVSIHWGPNMQEEPPDVFINFAHQMVHEGADVIHGHSAHIFQAVEVFNHKIILYDTGDFIDDYVIDPVLRNNLSFYFQLTISNKGIEGLQLFPVTISHYQVNFSSQPEAEWSIRRLQQLSSRFGTSINADGEVLLQKSGAKSQPNGT